MAQIVTAAEAAAARTEKEEAYADGRITLRNLNAEAKAAELNERVDSIEGKVAQLDHAGRITWRDLQKQFVI